MSHATRLEFPMTNNAAEYEALLLGLRKEKELGAKRVIIKSNSRLVVGHFDKSFMARGPEMANYLAVVRVAARHFLGIIVQAIPRGNNEAADKLAKMASSGERPPPKVFYKMLRAPTAAPEAQGVAHLVLLVVGVDWWDTIIKYLTGEEPEDATEAKRLR